MLRFMKTLALDWKIGSAHAQFEWAGYGAMIYYHTRDPTLPSDFLYKNPKNVFVLPKLSSRSSSSSRSSTSCYADLQLYNSYRSFNYQQTYRKFLLNMKPGGT